MNLQEGEVLILDGMGEYNKSFWKTIDGTFYLTNRRLAFYQPNKGFRFLLGDIGANVVKGTVPVLELALKDIKSIKESGVTYDFITPAGKFNFQFRKNKVWIDAIKKAIKEAK